jgi:hypothetical protein
MKKNNLFLYLHLFTAIFFVNNITAQTNAPVYIPYINKSNNKEILQFVKSNKHLPGIMPGNQIETNGLDITNTIEGITKNVEEHELYLHQLYKMILNLEKENQELKKEINELKNK